LVGKHEGKRSLGRSRRRWEDSIITDLKEIGWEDVAGFIWRGIGISGVLL
jgi:hypothetical protein